MDQRTTPSVTHWQIVTKDPEKIAQFYGDLFGWRFSAANGLGYRMLETSGGLDGGIWPAGENGHEMLQLFIAVDDIDEALARVRDLGGQIIFGKQVLPDGDAMAIALDPLGRSFGLVTRKK